MKPEKTRPKWRTPALPRAFRGNPRYLVISSYPEKGVLHGGKTPGAAFFAKALVQSLRQICPEVRMTVVADLHDRAESYEENGTRVHRIWSRNSLAGIYRILRAGLREPTDRIIVSFEGYMLGSLLYSALFVAGMLLWRLRGKHVVTILHEVVQDVGAVLPERKLKLLILNLLRISFYRLFLLGSTTTVVFEERLKNALGNRKVSVIPLAVSRVEPPDYRQSRATLGVAPGELLVLYFGFLAPYKGADALFDLWEPRSDRRLIAAGGNSPNHLDKAWYRSYLVNLHAKAAEKNIQITGFVPEDRISLYFGSADVVIFPYRTFFASSGPLSLAFAYEKPVLLSRPLSGYFDTSDFRDSLSAAGLTREDMLFDFSAESLRARLGAVPDKLGHLKAFSRLMKETRSWNKIGQAYCDLLA